MSNKVFEYIEYNSVDDAIKDLEKLTKIDVTSGKTTNQDLIDALEDVMIILCKCTSIEFDEVTKNQLSNTLKNLGYTTFNKVYPSYVDAEMKLLAAMNSKDNATFPMSALSQLIDTPLKTFRYGMSKLCEGGFNYGWIGEWLKTQGISVVEKNKADNELNI